MGLHENTVRLKALMADRKITLQQVAAITGRSYKSVRRWRSRSGKPIPDALLELLELKTRESK